MDAITLQAIAIVQEDVGLGITNSEDFHAAVQLERQRIIEMDNRE